MKKIVALIALVGAAAAAFKVVAQRRGQELGEFAGEWTERAKEAAGTATETAGDTAVSLKDTALEQAAQLKDAAKESATQLKDAAVDLREEKAGKSSS